MYFIGYYNINDDSAATIRVTHRPHRNVKFRKTGADVPVHLPQSVREGRGSRGALWMEKISSTFVLAKVFCCPVLTSLFPDPLSSFDFSFSSFSFFGGGRGRERILSAESWSSTTVEKARSEIVISIHIRVRIRVVCVCAYTIPSCNVRSRYLIIITNLLMSTTAFLLCRSFRIHIIMHLDGTKR